MNKLVLYKSPLIRMLELKDFETHVLFYNNKSYTVNDILRNAETIALNLTNNGFAEGDRALLLAEPSIDFISTLYAIIMCKGVTAIIDPDMGNALYLSRLKQFRPDWIFIDYRLALLQKFGWLQRLYRKINPDAFFVPGVDNVRTVAMGRNLLFLNSMEHLDKFKSKIKTGCNWSTEKSEREVLVTYTSGTLSEPKGVVHSDLSLVHSLELLARKIEKYRGNNMVSYLPHFALIGIMANVKVYLWKKDMPPSKRIAFIRKYDINIFFGPPVEMNEILDYCIARNIPFPKSLKYILLGSAPIYQSFLSKLKQFTDAEVECLYGMTENLLVSSILSDEKLSYAGKGDIVGTPFDGVEVKIAQDNEILLRSKQLFKGYLHLPRRKENAFHPTGDLGFVDSQGRIVLTGRKKNMIIRKEYNIYPGLYEPVINSIPGVEQAVMLGHYNDQTADEEVFLIVQRSNSLSEKALIEFLKSDEYGIDTSAMPDHIIFATIPRKGRQQKIDYQKLKELI